MNKTIKNSISAGILAAGLILYPISAANAQDGNFEGRKVRMYQIPGGQFPFDVTNNQLKNVDELTQEKYEDALADTKLGKRDEARNLLIDVRETDASDGKIDNYEIIQAYVDASDPNHTKRLFQIKYRKNHYNLKVTSNPEDPAYLFGEGYSHLKLNQPLDLFEAKIDLEKALEKTSDAHNKAIVHNTLGNVFYKENKIDDALAQYKEAIKLDNDNFAAHFNLGEIYFNKKGDIKSSIDEFKECLRIDPNDRNSKRNFEWLIRKS